jgi:hypothetical protein
MMRNHYLYTGICRESTSRVQRYLYPNLASTKSWKLCFQLLGTPPERGVDNVPRATSRKLRFPIWGEPPEPGTYSCQGTTFLDVRCTTATLDAWRRFSLPEKCSWYSNDNIVAPNTWEYVIALLETSTPKDAHCVLTVRRTYRGDCDVPRGWSYVLAYH